MKRRISMAVVSLLAAMVGGMAISSPAQAAPCPNGSICFFNGSDGTVLLDQRAVSIIPRTVCQVLGTYSTNRTSYIKNNSDETFFVYDGGSCQTTPGRIYARSEGRMTGQWNDSITSYFKA